MRPIQITRQVQIDLTIHNVGIQRAADDYATHPNTACYWDGCDNLAADAHWCDLHGGLSARSARQRMRDLRARREGAV